MRWHQKLDQEERDIIEMEKLLLGCNIQKVSHKENVVLDEIDNINLIKRRRSITSGKESAEDKDRKSLDSSQVSQKNRKLKKIEKSLKMLQNISNTSIEVEANDDIVDVTGRDLNKLWTRLTGHQTEKFEPSKNFHWNKSDLEKLYEEAKKVVLEDFDETSKFKHLFDNTPKKKNQTVDKIETDFSTMNSIENIATEEDSGGAEHELQDVREEGESELTPKVHIRVVMKPQEEVKAALPAQDPVQITDLDESFETFRTDIQTSLIKHHKRDSKLSDKSSDVSIPAVSDVISDKVATSNISKSNRSSESSKTETVLKFEPQKSDSSVPEFLEKSDMSSQKSSQVSEIFQKSETVLRSLQNVLSNEKSESSTLKSQSNFEEDLSVSVLKSESVKSQNKDVEMSQISPTQESHKSESPEYSSPGKSNSTTPIRSAESSPTKEDPIKNDVTSLLKIYDVSEIYKREEMSGESEPIEAKVNEDKSGSISTEISFNSESIHEIEEDLKAVDQTEQIEDISFPNFESTMNDTQLDQVDEEVGLNVIENIDIHNKNDSDDNSTSERRNFVLEKRLISINDSLEELSDIFEKAPIRQASKSASQSPDFSSSSSTLTYSTDKDFKDESKMKKQIENEKKKEVSGKTVNFLDLSTPGKLLHLRKTDEVEEKSINKSPENLEKSPKSERSEISEGSKWSEASGLSRITERTEKSESSGEFDGPSVEIPITLPAIDGNKQDSSESATISASLEGKIDDILKSQSPEADKSLKSEASPNSEPSIITKSEKTPEYKKSPEKSEMSEDLEILESIESDLSDLKSQESSESRKEFVKFINASIAKTMSAENPQSPTPGTSGTTPKASNASMPDIINEAEVLRRQQIVIEQEIKQLEQQVPYIFKLPPPYIPPAKDSPLSLIIPTDERIDEIVTEKLNQLELSGEGEEGSTSKKLETTNIYERIIIDMCREYFEEFKEPEEVQQFSYMKDNTYKNFIFYSAKDKRKCLQDYILKKIQRILIIPTKVNQHQLQQNSQIFPMGQIPLGAQFRPFHFYLNSINYCNSKRKRDNVDEILIHELVEDESKWLYFDQEESEIKNNLTNDIWDEILREAIDDMQEAYQKKYENSASDLKDNDIVS